MAVIPIPQHILNNGTIDTSDILNLYYLLTNALANDIAIDGGLTASSLITANGGLTVPSGQTATVAGTLSVTGSETVASSSIGTLSVTGSETVASSTITTLDVTGSATVPAATASGNPVQLAQVAQVEPLLSDVSGNTAAGSSTTTSVTFTAPTAGYVVGIAKLINADTQPYGIQFGISINGVNGQSDNTLLPMIEFQVVSVAAGESVTVTAEATVSSSGNATAFNIGVFAYFLPSP